jgi:hypothetical protein
MQTVIASPFFEIKGVEQIVSAMKHYMGTQLQNDQPMKELLAANESLQGRMQKANAGSIVMSSV